MTTAASDQTATAAHPRTRSMESWRARLGVLASRGEPPPGWMHRRIGG